MAITRLKRKGRKNKLKAKIRAQKFKVEGFAPVIKNVDVEAITASFSTATKKSKPAPKKAEEPKEEVVAEAAVVEEVKEAKPKKAPKAKKADAKETKEEK